MVQPPWKTVWQFFKKLSIELLHDLADPLLGIYKRIETICSHRNLYMGVLIRIY